ncbi:hypothetical protein [Massilia sp. CF038]|uniref:hypothetical protein n=1 Tax=Massilia sp. CF038 TaxID=1881045 RepID=UPI00091D35C3|nr:hypothetical protein [Massilia sp. CF038]SHG39851.1 hypothetical protein SAMN05428948_0263 [Massilia sp. CF038]
MHKQLAVLIGSLALGAYVWLQVPARPVPAAPAAAPQAAGRHWQLAGQGSLQSPFGIAAALPDSPPQRIAARRQRMQARQYSTPEPYYTMDLRTLTALARQGDSFAMIQMAEQYESEWEVLQDDPGFDRGADPARLSRQLFSLAIKSGYPHIAAVMAAKALDQGDLVDAHAWTRVAEALHDADSATLKRRAGSFQRLTHAERARAQASYDSLVLQLGLTTTEPR